MTNEHSNHLVSIIIPNLNSRDTIADCLKSIKAQTHQNFEVILVDAGSSDGCLDTVRDSFPWVRVLTTLGTGIGESNNAGIKVAKGNIIIFDLNSDETVDAQWLETIVNLLATRPDVGVVAGRRYIYGTKLLDSAGGRISRITGAVPAIGRNKKDSMSFDSPREVDYSPVIATRTDVVQKVGLCDTVYGVYYEDTDYCYRAKKAGFKILYLPEAKHYHRMSSTVGKSSSRKLYYEKRNRLRFILKNFPPPYMLTAFSLHLMLLTPLEMSLSLIKGNRQAARTLTSAVVWNIKNVRATMQSRY